MTVLMQFADFFARLLSLYSFLIWIRIILSWFNPYPREGSLTWYFSKLVDPYLNLFRSKRFHIGMLDFSPLFAIGLLSVLQSALNIFARYGTMRFAWLLQLALSAFWSYGVSVFFMIMIIMMIIRTIAAFSHSPNMRRMDMATEPLLRRIQQLLFPDRIVKDTTLCAITLVLLILFYFITRYLIQILITLCARIPF